MRHIAITTIITMTTITLLSGCATMSPAPSAEATLIPTSGNKASGSVTFTQQGESVMLTVKISGLTPGAHGFHIHDKGDCSAPDGTSAGGHFNPTAKPHGHPDRGDHHAGDMPALEADASGNASLSTQLRGVTLGEGANSIVGRGLIVHAAADDYTTQPTGNSGARLACGVIVKR